MSKAGSGKIAVRDLAVIHIDVVKGGSTKTHFFEFSPPQRHLLLGEVESFKIDLKKARSPKRGRRSDEPVVSSG